MGEWRNAHFSFRGIFLMYDSPLHAMNMFYYHWLIKEAALAYIRAEYSQAGRDIERESR